MLIFLSNFYTWYQILYNLKRDTLLTWPPVLARNFLLCGCFLFSWPFKDILLFLNTVLAAHIFSRDGFGDTASSWPLFRQQIFQRDFGYWNFFIEILIKHLSVIRTLTAIFRQVFSNHSDDYFFPFIFLIMNKIKLVSHLDFWRAC